MSAHLSYLDLLPDSTCTCHCFKSVFWMNNGVDIVVWRLSNTESLGNATELHLFFDNVQSVHCAGRGIWE